MKRHEFITLLGGAAVAWPIAARAVYASHWGGWMTNAMVARALLLVINARAISQTLLRIHHA